MGSAECGIKKSNHMRNENLKKRTKQFALDVIAFVESLPPGQVSHVLGRQLLRSATSVGANYRSACRARSTADFIAKMGIVEEEADESGYWMELLTESGKVKAEATGLLLKEANELVAITVASINTAKKSSSVAAKNSALRIPHSPL